VLGIATKKLKFEGEEISEILVADTDSESGAEVSDVEEEEEDAGKSQVRPTPSLVGRPSVAAANAVWLKSRHNQHWPAKSTQLRCRLCSSRGQRKTTVFKCAKCDVGLCMVPCFVEYHTKVNL